MVVTFQGKSQLKGARAVFMKEKAGRFFGEIVLVDFWRKIKHKQNASNVLRNS